MCKKVVALGLALSLVACNKMSKEQATSAVSAYYSNEAGRVECEASIDVVPSESLFACDDLACRRCANALVDAKQIFKTEKNDIFRYPRTSMSADPKTKKLVLFCAKRTATINSFSSREDMGFVSVDESTQPETALEAVEPACGITVPKRDTTRRELRLQRDGDLWKVVR